MVSATSGTVTFSLDVDEIIEQALDPLGGEHQSGIDGVKARRVLNLILIQLQNKNIPLNKLDFMTQALDSADPTYVLDTTIVDVLECSISKDSLDLPLQRYSLKEYQRIPKKDQAQARPNLFVTERKNAAVSITFWPVQDNDDCTAKMLVSKKVEDITASYQKIDLNTRYLPLLIKWLSYELSVSKQGIPEELRVRLKAEYLEAMPDTFEEDRERSDFFVRPGGISGR